MPPEDQSFDALVETMKKAAAALRGAAVPFVLGGGLACWARGGPETEHDVDFLVRRADATRAMQALAESGMRTEEPPEGWLYKAWDDGVMIDVIFDTRAGPIDDETFDRAEELEVGALRVAVSSLEDVLVTKLLAIDEQYLDFDSVLEISRSLREQIDWADVRGRTAGSPFAKAFFTLVEEIGIVPRDQSL